MSSLHILHISFILYLTRIFIDANFFYDHWPQKNSSVYFYRNIIYPVVGIPSRKIRRSKVANCVNPILVKKADCTKTRTSVFVISINKYYFIDRLIKSLFNMFVPLFGIKNHIVSCEHIDGTDSNFVTFIKRLRMIYPVP